jgi:DNA polymerase elongation subunit (family B)
MYRAASYNPFNESVFLRTWTEDGQRIDTEIPFRPFLYLEKDGAEDAVSIFKTSLMKKTFKNSLERKKFVDNTANKRIFHNLGPEQQFLIDMYKEQNGDPNFSQFPLKVFLLDIETYSPNAFPTPEKAADPINLITIYDTLTKMTHTWGLKEQYTPTLPDCIYHRCKDEQDLILQFVDFWKSDYPDISSGWASSTFDFPYIINRFARLFGDDFVKQLSPVGNVRGRKVFTDMGKEVTMWSIGGVALIDYLDLYKTFSPGEKESFKLDYIASIELGEGKTAYNATSLADLADTDWKLFVDYNIQDVHLLVKLEEKLKFLEIARLLSYKGCTNFEAALGKVAIVTGAVAIQAHKQGMVIPTFPNSLDREAFEGGFVRDPERGIQKSIVSFDVNSLYPNTIITLNISPETKLGKVVQGDFEKGEEVTISLLNGKMYTLPFEKFKKFLVDEKVALTKAGVLYSQKTKGILPNLIDQIYKERVEAKTELQRLKKTKKTDFETFKKITYYNNIQSCLKVLLNSAYGVTSNKHSAMMDLDHAMSITATGQSVAKAGSTILDEYVREKYGINQSVTLYSDTDSCSYDTQLRTNIGEMPIGMLYDSFHKTKKVTLFKGHEIVNVLKNDIKIPTYDSVNCIAEWGKVKSLVRHKVSKKKYKIVAGGKEVIMTEDHGCMVMRDGKLLRVAPADINIKTDKMIVLK